MFVCLQALHIYTYHRVDGDRVNVGGLKGRPQAERVFCLDSGVPIETITNVNHSTRGGLGPVIGVIIC